MYRVAHAMIVPLLCVLSSGLAVANDAPGEDALSALYAQGLLAPRMDDSDRTALLDQLRREVEDDDGSAAYVLGALYSQGQWHPARLVERSAMRARDWYLVALERGQIWAMPKLAELALAEGNEAEAMAWAQLFARFQVLLQPGQQDAYAPELIMRMFARRPGLTKEQAAADIDALLAEHKALIDRGIAAWKQQQVAGKAVANDPNALRVTGGFIRAPREGVDRVEKTPTSIVEYVLAIEPNGKVSEAWLLDAVPDYTLGERLRKRVFALRFNPSTEPGQRFARLPVVFTQGRFGFAGFDTDARRDASR